MGGDQGYVFDLNKQKVQNTFFSGKDLIDVKFINGLSHFISVDKSGVPEVWDTTSVLRSFSNSSDVSFDADATFKFQPVFFPITFEISIKNGFQISWTGETSFVTPIGKFTTEVKLSSEIESQIESAKINNELIVILENSATGEKAYYSVAHGSHVKAVISGKSTIEINNKTIHIIITEANETVRFLRE